MSAFWQECGEGTTRTANYLRWFVSERCNYHCSYCSQDHSGKRPLFPFSSVRSFPDFRKWLKMRKRNSTHMFDNYPPELWLEAARRLCDLPTSITLTGGEPFRDWRNFGAFLSGLSHIHNVKCIRIDTNGCWNPERYPEIDWSKIYLNFSFHPEMISFEKFLSLLDAKTKAGIKIGMVNFVMAPSQFEGFASLRQVLADRGIAANANVYFGPLKQTERGHELYRRYVPAFDIAIKTHQRPTRGRLCHYPMVAYEIHSSGFIETGCFPARTGDLLAGSIPRRFAGATPCPNATCGCLDKYAFLEGSGRSLDLNLMAEYVQECDRVAS